MTETKQEKKTEWVKMKPADIEKKVIELAKENTPPEKIGLILRDQHGIPKARIFGKKIGQILEENGLLINSEKENIEKKLDKLKKHFEKNKHDYSAKRSIITYTGRINKIKKQAAA